MLKVIAKIKGGLGNQLFCYAAARRLAIVNNADLILDAKTGFIRDFQYRRHYQLGHFNIASPVYRATENSIYFLNLILSIKKLFNRFIPFNLKGYIEQSKDDFNQKLIDLKLSKNIYLDGYWQSYKYFEDVSDIIKNDLKILKPDDEVNIALGLKINESNAVAIHFRFFDQDGTSDSKNSSENYYRIAIELMEEKCKNSHYFIFSDRPYIAQSLLKIPKHRITIVDNNASDENAYADLWLMTQCKHFIIANSTFSWWGAWLGMAADKIVVAPAMKVSGVGAWGFEGLLPKEWIKL